VTPRSNAALGFKEHSMNAYMLLFWAPKTILAKPRLPEQAKESGALWQAWERAMRSAGHSVTGAQLDPGGRCVSGASKVVVDGPFGNGHVMGGYFVVSASSLEQATDLAKGCPVLRNGGTVEVRPIMDVE
jgi:hypothetical protein